MDEEAITIFKENFLKEYYKTIFPSDLFCRWLSYGNMDYFAKREFSFTLKNDIYIRYQSFESVKEFTDQLIAKNPYKIDIGAIYNIQPKNKNKVLSSNFTPKSKEFVIDIDMSDYNDVRFCCDEAKICVKCWTICKAAILVLDHAMRKDFGWKHIIWIYSGRRGVHAWVCDKSARESSHKKRSAFVNHLTYIRRSRYLGKLTLKTDFKLTRSGFHPCVKPTLDIIRQFFKKYAIDDQAMFDCQRGIDRLVALLPDSLAENRDYYKKHWAPSVDGKESLKRWKQFVTELEEDNKSKVVDEVMLEVLCPRLDENVSTGLNHLLKSPFSVHPSTNQICVPIDISNLDQFDPFSVPRLDQLCTEMRNVGDVRLTSLGPYVALMEKLVSQIDQ